MAVRAAIADGVFTAAGTWGVVDATSLLDSEAANTLLTTSYVESATFTPGAITIDGIAIKVATRAVSPTGTITVRLATGGVTVVGTELAINVSDLASRDGEQGWYFFKFTPVLLLAATLYTVSAKTSSASQVNLFRNATAGNWSRLLRTTTTGAPAAGDSLHVLAEYTAAATRTTRTVTMDQNATTDYGDGSAANPPGFTIGNGGTVTWGTTAATTYRLRLSTRLAIYVGGTMTMGTVATPMPRDSSALLEFDGITSDGDAGLQVFGTFTAQGQSRTIAKIVTQCLLNTNEAAAQTTLGVDIDTGWLSGDEIAIASTSRTYSEAETRVLNGAAGASSLAVTVGLTSAHSGTSPTQAEVILLTRNVRIESVSTTLMAFVFFGVAATVDVDWASFRYMGSTTTGRRGVEIQTTSAGNCNIAWSSIRDFDSHGIYVTGAAFDNVTLFQVVGYKVGAQTTGHSAIGIKTATTGVNWSVTFCTIIGNNAGGGYGFEFADVGGTMASLVATSTGGSGAAGILISEALGIGSMSSILIHSCNGFNMLITAVQSLAITTFSQWRGSSGGLDITGFGELVFDTGSWFGNATANVSFTNNSGALTGRVTFRSLTIAGDSTFSTGSGMTMPPTVNRGFPYVRFDNCTFGSASGIFVAHATQDIDFGTGSTKFVQLYLNRTLLASATELANSSVLYGRSFIAYQRVDQATNIHQTVYPKLGTVARDTVTFRTSSPSEKLTPSGAVAAFRLRSGPRKKRIASGGTVTFAVYVRKSAGYVGSAVRLVQLANPAIGVLVDTVLASMSGPADAWEQLTATVAAAVEAGVVECVVECDGSAGDVYTDDWS